ncbi:MAG: hypothetical protein F6J98_22545 [Moorea sp. SIO4G2]|nr:hypothetical protein [Moorena sp. SIO4G2]
MFSKAIVDLKIGSRESGVGSRESWEVWGDGEMGRWGDGEMGRWGDGEMGRWGNLIEFSVRVRAAEAVGHKRDQRSIA